MWKAITGAGSLIAGMWIGWSRAASQSPARVSLSFATAPMSPGPNASVWVDVLAARLEQLPDPLLVVGARVEHVRVVRHHALVDAEEVDAAGERVGAGLEDVGEHLAVLDRLERHLLDLEAAVLDGRGQVVDDRVEQPVGAQAGRGDAAGDREDVAVVGAVLERGDDLLVGDLLALEVALHQRLGVLRDLVHQLLAVLLRLVGEVVGDRDLLAVLAEPSYS